MRTAFVLLFFALCQGNALAQKVYKHVDDKGNITYSQTPPASDAKAINVPAPRRVPTTTSHGRSEELRAARQAEYDRRRLEHERAREESREALIEARRKQTEALRAECVRNRGTDCDDPATLARMQNERGPYQYRPRAR